MASANLLGTAFLRDMNFIALLREQTLVRDLGGLLDQVTLLSLQCERASQVNSIQFKRLGDLNSAW